MRFVIYKATNLENGKSYIGFDSDWPARTAQHIQVSHNPNHPQYNSLFHRAIRKYGANTFTWSILYESNVRTHTLQTMEPHFIREHNTHYLIGHGYNMTYGGEGHSGPRTETNKRNNSLAQLGKILTEEHKQRISLGVQRTLAPKISKSWIVISPEGEEFIIINLRRFCIEHGLDQGNMMKVVNGRSRHCKGWKCRRP